MYRLALKPPDNVQQLHLLLAGNDVITKRNLINNKGCALTALSMALDYAGASQLPDGSDNQPGHLNTFLTVWLQDIVGTRSGKLS